MQTLLPQSKAGESAPRMQTEVFTTETETRHLSYRGMMGLERTMANSVLPQPPPWPGNSSADTEEELDWNLKLSEEGKLEQFQEVLLLQLNSKRVKTNVISWETLMRCKIS